MDFSLTPDQTELGELTARILATARPEELWDRLAEADLLGVVVPGEFGGLGLGPVEQCEVLRRFGRDVGRIPLLPGAIAAAAVARSGSPVLSKSLLPDHCAGRSFGTEGFSTGRAALRLDNGLLTGSLRCVPYGQQAAWVVAPVSTPDGPRAVVAQLRGPQVSSTAQERTDHTPSADVHFDRAPVSELLDGVGWMEQFGALATCAVQLGVAQRALELVAEYTPVRKQFGRPLASFQAVGQRAADGYIDVWAQELTLQSALWQLADGPDAALAVHLARLWAARGGQQVVATAVHLHGGAGADRSYPLHRLFLTQTALSGHFGGAGQQLHRIGDLMRTVPGEVV